MAFSALKSMGKSMRWQFMRSEVVFYNKNHGLNNFGKLKQYDSIFALPR